jgi:hypothetical protein
VERSFKIGKFTCEKKTFSENELKSLLTQTRKRLKELKGHESGKSFESIDYKIKALEEQKYEHKKYQE